MKDVTHATERSTASKGHHKGIGDDIKHGAEKMAGKAKEEWGDLTDNERLEAEGRRTRWRPTSRRGRRRGRRDARRQAGPDLTD